MTKDDFEELIDYTDIRDAEDAKIAIVAGAQVVKPSRAAIHVLSELMGISPATIKSWFSGVRSPGLVQNRKYIMDWLITQIKEIK